MTYRFPLPIPTLVTDRLTLRAPRESDFAAMLAFNDSARAGFVGGSAPRQQVWRGLLANIGTGRCAAMASIPSTPGRAISSAGSA